jgi:hypothetical protein
MAAMGVRPSRFTTRRVILLAVVAVAILAGLLIHYSAGTRTTRYGHYGPLQIGDEKEKTLLRLVQLGVGYIEPLPYESIFIENPSDQDIAKLDQSDGVMVRLSGDYFPLRIEFVNGQVSRTWPLMETKSYQPANARENTLLYAQLQARLKEGMPRHEAMQSILEFGRAHDIKVENFVAGWQELRIQTDPDIRSESYRALLLRNDSWEFEGLKEEVWYDPFYSQVRLFFREGRLQRIEHFVFPFELP